MKKCYETPTASTTVLGTASFLEISGEIWAVDQFDDGYGETFH